MEKTHTQRGFGRYNFVDDYGAECSLQRSSSGVRIWLGCGVYKQINEGEDND